MSAGHLPASRPVIAADLEIPAALCPETFIALARTEHRYADQERRLDAFKRAMADRILAHPAGEVYDADVAAGSRGDAGDR